MAVADTSSSLRDARCPLCLPIVEVVSGEHGAVCGVEVEPPDAVGVQQVHETARERKSAGWRMDACMCRTLVPSDSASQIYAMFPIQGNW